MASVLAVTLRAVQNNASAANAASERREAMLIAQSQLAQLGRTTALESGNGSADGFTWDIRVTPFTEERGSSASGALQVVEVIVRRDGAVQPSARLASLMLQPVY